MKAEVATTRAIITNKHFPSQFRLDADRLAEETKLHHIWRLMGSLSILYIRFLHWEAFSLVILGNRHRSMVCDDINNIISTFSYVLRRHNWRNLVAVQGLIEEDRCALL